MKTNSENQNTILFIRGTTHAVVCCRACTHAWGASQQTMRSCKSALQLKIFKCGTSPPQFLGRDSEYQVLLKIITRTKIISFQIFKVARLQSPNPRNPERFLFELRILSTQEDAPKFSFENSLESLCSGWCQKKSRKIPWSNFPAKNQKNSPTSFCKGVRKVRTIVGVPRGFPCKDQKKSRFRARSRISSENEIFERATHRRIPKIFCGESPRRRDGQ